MEIQLQHTIMNPVERIIIRHYAANTFMFDHNDERYYTLTEKDNVLSKIKRVILKEQAINMSKKDIKSKYKYLRDNFVKTDKLIEAKKDITYLQKCLYQRMYFIKPFLSPNPKTKSTYEVKRNIQSSETCSEAFIKELEAYRINTQKLMPNKYVNMLNKKIQEKSDTRVQRLKFCIILKSIRAFKYLESHVEHTL
ncbi:hypothetical protein TSAR_011398 [Trichomalopsis sarcophagae]|uniref:MADF domain-containing protein n=1 Tax=Trichomalopsis sarcophagae TaxID=543379 RepID=A0A232ETY0_9HYME|nr:hypothetical protein TSAR_011398 [Trichomalopsis sarcophagae]